MQSPTQVGTESFQASVECSFIILKHKSSRNWLSSTGLSSHTEIPIASGPVVQWPPLNPYYAASAKNGELGVSMQGSSKNLLTLPDHQDPAGVDSLNWLSLTERNLNRGHPSKMFYILPW
jgi:hypothetical protein